MLLMGFFGTYMGLIYNDFMSMPLRLFGMSCYEFADGRPEPKLLPDKDCIYPFGMDPIWMKSSNEISFYNSFKMKTSVILGIAQMTLGILLKGLNAGYFGKRLDIYHEFLPQLILLLCMFGYMDMIIIQKWLIDWKGQEEESRAPSVVNIMIQMFINGGEIPDPQKELPVLENQTQWSKAMLYLALICPPWMLLVKPLILKNEHDKEKKVVRVNGGHVEMGEVDSAGLRKRQTHKASGKIELTPLSTNKKGEALTSR